MLQCTRSGSYTRVNDIPLHVHLSGELTLSQVDDGTAVIDCSHPQPAQPKVEVKRTSSELPAKPEPPPVPKPLAKVGNFVRVAGKVREVYGSRQIVLDRIGLSMNIN